MGARELVALVAIPLVVGAILFLPAWVFGIILSGALAIAAKELVAMAHAAGIIFWRTPVLIAVPGFLAAAWFAGVHGVGAAALVALWVFPTLQLMHPMRPQGALTGMATSFFAVLYLGGGGACIAWIRLWPSADAGAHLLLLFLFTIWAGDSGAYYVGKRWGRHSMSPRVSPKKTWEGIAGGVAATFIVALILQRWLHTDLAMVHLLGLAAILAVSAPVGDLIESLFKRDTQVKDSSNLLPGHGGFLDRTDSLVYSAPPVLAYLAFIGYFK
ncbi:MAG: phosphatidate cytidylyltransferase [bacterium]|nr:phosphatidate cytidylyltransferase [bacterium]